MDNPCNGLDRLTIHGIRGYGYTGVFPEEQSLGQWFAVDLCLWLDLRPAAAADDLSDGLDYAAVVQQVQALLKNSRCRTLERLNSQICDTLLVWPAVQRVESTLTKVAAPIPGFDGRVAVTMDRDKDQSNVTTPEPMSK